MILLDDKIVFFHFPKTSGTSIKRNAKTSNIIPLIRCIRNNMFLLDNNIVFFHFDIPLRMRHVGINHLPHKYYTYPIIGMIRNPFSFYVSFYNYFRNNKLLSSPNKEILFCKYFIEDRNINLDDFDEVKKDFNKHLKLLVTKGDEHKIQIQNYNCGLISRLYQFLYIKNNTDIVPEITIIKMEEYDKLNILLSKYNINLTESKEKINASKEVDYKLYYTPETIKLVESYDSEIIQKYNYHF